MAIMDKLACFGKKLNFILLFSIPFTLHAVHEKNKPALIDVKIGVMESLSPTAPSSSERYKRFLEAAIYYAAGENEAKLNKCGYRLIPSIHYFDSYDIQELLTAGKNLESTNAWIIIGPRRSGHFLIAAKNLNGTPIVSTMANAEEIYQLNKTTFSMYPSAAQLAHNLSKELKAYGKTYGVVVDVRCKSCTDFANAFSQNHAGKLVFTHEVASNTPELKALINKIAQHPVDFIVVPNYSDLSGFIIGTVQKHYPKIRYVGADGWGEDSFSFMQGYGVNKTTEGIAIRGGVKKEDKCRKYAVNSLEREINGEIVTPPNSIYALVDSIRILSKDLCESKAKDKPSFAKYLANKPKSHFQKNTTHSIYELKDGKLEFAKYVESK